MKTWTALRKSSPIGLSHTHNSHAKLVNHLELQIKAAIGLGGSILGLVTSTQEHLLWGVQVFAALMGGLVAMCSLLSIVSKWLKVRRTQRAYQAQIEKGPPLLGVHGQPLDPVSPSRSDQSK